MLTLSLSHYLILGAILFAISVVGIFLNRKNLLVLLMAIELMLLAVNMNFVAFRTTSRISRARSSSFHPDGRRGRIRHRPGHPDRPVPQLKSIHVDDLDSLKG